MIKAVIFDWGGVLIDDPYEPLLEYCSEKLGTTKDKLKKSFDLHLEGFQRGVVTEGEQWKTVCAEIGIDPPRNGLLWKEAVRMNFHDRQQVYELVLSLKKNGYKTGYLSNTEMPAREYFLEMGYDKFFDAAVFSCSEGFVKPEEQIYQVILERLQVKPDEAAFIDDKSIHIEGAKRVGINGILYEDFNKLQSALLSLNVIV